ncbi:MAG: hypothetical protein ACR2NL_06165, partial [Acidimicrobiia bacterium]
AVLPPGENTFDWFEPSFTIVNDEPWAVDAQVGHMVIFDSLAVGPSNAVQIYAFSEIADPEQPIWDWDGEAIPTVDVPDDLTAWVDAMPLVGTSTPLTIGGVDAAYWQLEYDRTADNNGVVLSVLDFVDGTLYVDLDSVLHLWHIPRPDGSVFLIEQVWEGIEGPPERQAPEFFDNFRFD